MWKFAPLKVTKILTARWTSSSSSPLSATISFTALMSSFVASFLFFLTSDSTEISLTLEFFLTQAARECATTNYFLLRTDSSLNVFSADCPRLCALLFYTVFYENFRILRNFRLEINRWNFSRCSPTRQSDVWKFKTQISVCLAFAIV